MRVCVAAEPGVQTGRLRRVDRCQPRTDSRSNILLSVRVFLLSILQRKRPTVQQQRQNNQRIVRYLCRFGNTQRAVP